MEICKQEGEQHITLPARSQNVVVTATPVMLKVVPMDLSSTRR